jgi:hypothetical protein
MARVWLARDEMLGRDVAIKEIDLPDEIIGGDRDAVKQRTLREARAAARINHPNVVRLYDVLETDGRPWLVMEYVPSRTLYEMVQADGPLPPEQVTSIGLQMVAALGAAHRVGVWHRDVKPANVLVTPDGRAVLTDFGIATVDGDGFVTRSGLVLGSPEYIAPERARDGTAGPAADLWSLGATLYYAVEGRSPYQRASVVETLTALAADEPDPPRRAGPLEPVLYGLLRKHPASRTKLAETERRLRAAINDAPRRPRRDRARARLKAVAAQSAAAAARLKAATARLKGVATRHPDRRRRVLVATGLALVVAAATWPAIRSQPDGAGWHTPGQAARPSATATDTGPDRPPTPVPTPTPTPVPTTAGPVPGAGVPEPGQGAAAQRPPLPPGWQDYTDPTGFSLYVPAGWNRTREGTMVYFRDPASGRVLGIDQTRQPKPDPVADWRGQANYRVARGDFPGYQEIHIVAVPYWRRAADWEFTFNGQGRQHVNNRGFITSASQAYGIYWQTRDSDWAAARRDLQLIFDSFRPAPGR